MDPFDPYPTMNHETFFSDDAVDSRRHPNGDVRRSNLVDVDNYHAELLCHQIGRVSIMEQTPYNNMSQDMRRMRAQSAATATEQFPPFYNYDHYRHRGLLNEFSALYNSQPNAADAFSFFNRAEALIHSLNSNRLNSGVARLFIGGERSYAPQQNMNIGRPSAVARQLVGSLDDMRGRIVSVAKDQHGCRFLQSKLEEGNPEDIQMIFLEIKDHLYELIVHQFGNYLIPKFVEVCTQDQLTQLLLLVTSDDHKFAEMCADNYGSKAVQKLVESLRTPEQKCRIVSVLRRITVPLTKIMSGHHMIQHCFKSYSFEDNKHILNVVADNCLDIATDKSGCCVLQQCLEYARGEPLQRLIVELTSNALILSQHPYGNYVVQYILGLKIGHATADIMRVLSGHYVSLCMNKYGSNVVERCLKEAAEDQQVLIINEIIYSPQFLRVLQDPFGNYVAQKSLDTCKGPLLRAIIEMIHQNANNLHSHPHGKRVLEKTNKQGFKAATSFM